MHRISVLGSETIAIGENITINIAQEVAAIVKASFYIIITDSNLAKHGHSDNLERILKEQLVLQDRKSSVLTLVIPPGEAMKTREIKSFIENWLLERKCTRDSCFIALGGGVIGDMIGFVASTFMRGAPIIQVPTTLLAMVDSSVGGKTAVDTPHGKNLVGTFHQPKRIFMDLAYLKTLPKRQFINGMAEVIKTAAIWSENDFSILENNCKRILDYSSEPASAHEDAKLLIQVIKASVNVKAHVVTIDEKETGLRGLLNFGHTIGHAFEAILAPEILHGECVSIGMIKEAEVSRNLGYLKDVCVGRLLRCLQAYGLPTSIDDKIIKKHTRKQCDVNQLLDIMKTDKKTVGNQKKIVLLSSIGKTQEDKASNVPDNIIYFVLCPSVKIPATLKPHSPNHHITLNVPGSKSISNRALVLAALGSGVCRLRGLLNSDDVQVMLSALEKIVGIKFKWEEEGDVLVIDGGAGRLQTSNCELFLGNAGTASRFLTSVCALLKKTELGIGTTILTGNDRMKQRPIGPLVDALRGNGCEISYRGSVGCLPLEITPTKTGLQGGTIHLSASISSQYVSSILMAAPLANSPVTLILTGGAVISQPYIDMTIAMMRSFGINVTKHEDPSQHTYYIPLGIYENPSEYLIEADASSATYPLAFAALTQSKVTVSNIGSDSLQGDAHFAVRVLETMGCLVEQTATSTTVCGPERLLPIENIDMETMTDAFLTASVLAACASSKNGNKTRIYGIANQKVKECDRISVMIEQLAKFGVKAEQFDDGLEIYGVELSALTVPEGGVKCYDDHRVAMSFSLLACALENGKETIIHEKKCVEKTWPAWWDTLSRVMKVSVYGETFCLERNDIPKPSQHQELSAMYNFQKDERSIVIIGMRGVGKTHAGRALARDLSRKFIDMDEYLESQLKTTIPTLIKEKGWDAFRIEEAKLLQHVLIEYSFNTVISCGGGIVESLIAREILHQWGIKSGHVIHLKRNIDEVAHYLNKDKTRPMYGEDMKLVWERRKPIYDSSSTYEFFLLQSEDHGWGAVEKDFLNFVNIILSGTLEKVDESLLFFLSLTCADVSSALPDIHELVEGIDIIELRVDMLTSYEDEFVAAQIYKIRQRSKLPILFTVRTLGQGGNFPDEKRDLYEHLLSKAVRWGCEYLDVEVYDDENSDLTTYYTFLKQLNNTKQNTKIVASYHDTKGEAIWHLQTYASISGGTLGVSTIPKKMILMELMYEKLSLYGDIVKLISKANTEEDNFCLEKFKKHVQGLVERKPLIAINMGSIGQITRALNTFLTPVTHSKLATSGAPGQLSVSEINTLRKLLGINTNRDEYYLFGSPIATSMSPLLHNTGFSCLGLSSTYWLYETASWESVLSFINERTNFKGASVTIPLKEDVLKHGVCSVLSQSALEIGCVNTLMKLPDGKIRGDNTDWIGMRNSILGITKTRSMKNAIGVVLGAGGTGRAACFALKSFDCKEIRIWNRTLSKAELLKTHFEKETGPRFKVVGSISEIFAITFPDDYFVIINTIPGSAQEELDLKALGMTLSTQSGVFVEMAYRPRVSLLVELFSETFSVVYGVDVLIQQGYEQFKLWTGMKPPRHKMKSIVMEAYYL